MSKTDKTEVSMKTEPIQQIQTKKDTTKINRNKKADCRYCENKNHKAQTHSRKQNNQQIFEREMSNKIN